MLCCNIHKVVRVGDEEVDLMSVARVHASFPLPCRTQAVRAMAGDGRPNPIYRQMLVLAVRAGAAGAARYFDPENATLPRNDRALAKVRQCFYVCASHLC